jgi:hypothetical protein
MRLRPRPVGRVARTAVIAGTATAVSGRVARRQQSNNAAQEPAPAPPAVAAAPAAPAQASDVEQLQQLAALHEQGILTDEEFAAKKQQILGL